MTQISEYLTVKFLPLMEMSASCLAGGKEVTGSSPPALQCVR